MSLHVQRHAGMAGVVGGLLWAVTPLRQPIFDAGRTPDEGETVFRVYNLVLIVIAILLTIALLRLRHERGQVAGRSFALGWWIVLVGHALILVGSLPAVVFGDQRRDLVMGGQDLGFLGAMIAGLGGLLVGISVLLRRGRGASLASWLFLLTLPLGILATVLLTAMGVHEDYLGLPVTVLYGGAWVALGSSWLQGQEENASSAAADVRR